MFYLCKIQEENVPSLTQNEIFLYIFARIEYRILQVKKQYAVLHGKMSGNIVSMFFFSAYNSIVLNK